MYTLCIMEDTIETLKNQKMLLILMYLEIGPKVH